MQLIILMAIVAAQFCLAFPNVRYVRLELSTSAILVINEVTVYPCNSSVNVALNQPTTGSAFGSGGCSGTAASRAPAQAVDGSTSCSAGITNTFCSNSAPLFWQVDLGVAYDVCSVAIILSTTGSGATYLRFRDAAATQINSVTLPQQFASLTTCTATSCSVSAQSCTTCTTALCNNHASTVSQNYPACACTCNSGFTGPFCASTAAPLCTNAVNCNGNAASVAGTIPSCACTCNAAWTGTDCSTPNVCTVPDDCSNQATTVTGNRPSCTCTCQPEWTGTTCAVPNVCTNAVDCSSQASAVSGNRPTCSCTCSAGWTGSSCATSTVCTVPDDCSNQATTVAGNRPSCTCTCQPEWTGATCSTSNVCTNTPNCNGHASTITGNRPLCSCTCQPEWTGSTCATSNVCTDSVDCNSRSTAVTGNRPSCTCTCSPQWTGSSCQTSNACTNSVDCDSRATAVGGNRPTCACTCASEWTGSSCQTSNVCTNSVDCNNNARVVSGNRPTCTCACKPGISGLHCDHTHTLTRTSSTSPSVSFSKSPTMSGEGTSSISSSKVRTVSAPTVTEEPTSSRSTSISLSVTRRTQSSEGTLSLTRTQSSDSSRSFSTSISLSSTGSESSSKTVPTRTLDISRTQPSLSLTQTTSQSSESSLTHSGSLSLSQTSSTTSSFSKSIGFMTRSGTHDASLIRTLSLSAEAKSSTSSSSLTPTPTMSSTNDVSMIDETLTASNSFSDTHTRPTVSSLESLTQTKPSGSSEVSVSLTQSAQSSPSWSSSLDKSISRSATESSVGSRSITASSSLTYGSATKDASTSKSSSVSTTSSLSMSMSEELSTSKPSTSMSSSHSGPTLSLSVTNTIDKSSSESATLSHEGGSMSKSNSATQSPSLSRGTPELTSSTSLTNEAPSTTSSRSVTASLLSFSRNQSKEVTMSVVSHSMTSSQSFSGAPTLSYSVTSHVSPSWSLSISLDSATRDASPSFTQSSVISSCETLSNSYSKTSSSSSSATTTLSLNVSPTKQTLSPSLSRTLASLTRDETRSVSSSLSPPSWTWTRPPHSATAPIGSPTSTHTLSSGGSTSSDSSTHSAQSRSMALTQSMSKSLSMTQATHRLSATISSSQSGTATSSSTCSDSVDFSGTSSVSATVSVSESTTASDTVSTSPSPSTSDTLSHTTSGSYHTKTATLLIFQPLPFTISNRPFAWLSDGIPMIQAPSGVNITTGPSLQLFPVDANGLTPTNPNRAPIHVSLSDATRSLNATNAQLIGFPLATPPLVLLPCSIDGTAASNTFGVPVDVIAVAPQFLLGVIIVRYPTLNNTLFSLSVAIAPVNNTEASSEGLLWSTWEGGVMQIAHGVPQSLVLRNADGVHAARIVQSSWIRDAISSEEVIPTLTLSAVLLPFPQTLTVERVEHSNVTLSHERLASLPPRSSSTDASTTHNASLHQLVEMWKCMWPTAATAFHQIFVATAAADTMVAFMNPWSRAIEDTLEIEWMCTVAATDDNITSMQIPAVRKDPCTLSCVVPLLSSANIVFSSPLLHVSLSYKAHPSACLLLAPFITVVASAQLWQLPLALTSSILIGSMTFINSAQGCNAVLLNSNNNDEDHHAVVVVSLQALTIHAMTSVTLPTLYASWWARDDKSVGGNHRRSIPLEALRISPSNVSLSTSGCLSVPLQCAKLHFIGSSTLVLDSCVTRDFLFTACLEQHFAGLPTAAMNVSIHLTNPDHTIQHVSEIHVVVDLNCTNELLWNETITPTVTNNWFVSGCPADAFPVTGRCAVIGGDLISFTVPLTTVSTSMNNFTVDITFSTRNGSTSLPCTSLMMTLIDVTTNTTVFSGSCRTPPMPGDANITTATLHIVSSTLGGNDSVIIAALHDALYFSGAMSCPFGRIAGSASALQECSGNGVCDRNTLSCVCYGDANLGYFTGYDCSRCIAGAYGKSCTSRCPTGSSGCAPCSGHGTCDDGILGSGLCTCVGAAAQGFWGSDDCNSCSAGYYGSMCTSLCPGPTFSAATTPAVLRSVCNRHGNCDDGVYGGGLCTCTAAYQGALCNSCSPGYYGTSCTRCPSHNASTQPCSGHGSCSDGNQGSGDCSCTVGYAGAACNISCPIAFGLTCGWGVCSAVTGRCTCTAPHVVVDPTSGGACSACDDGYWGVNCTRVCPCQHGTCDVFTGACICAVGYWGVLCSNICPGGASSPCTNHGVCSQTSGHCACFASQALGYYTGTSCDQCNASYASPSCNVPCPTGSDPTTGNPAVCSNRGTCFNGTCSGLCVSGYWGASCQHECPGGAANPCNGRGSCDALSGYCTCVYGAVGTACDGSCQGGFSSPCSFHGLCTATGACQCDADTVNGFWSGAACTTCAAPYSGQNCSVPCDTRTGTVKDRTCVCATGYVGNQCNIACPVGYESEQASTPTPCTSRGVCSLNPSNNNSTSAECACVADYYDAACGTYCTVALCLTVSGLLNPQCNVTTGQCECRASANGNFGGPTCNDCAAGYWGAECSLPCPCNSRGSCDRYTGSCQCAAGVGSGYWTGHACDKCAPGYIGTLCNVWNVEVSEAASAVVSTANSLFPLSGIVLHDSLMDVVLVGSNPLAAFHTTPWESNMTFLQTVNATYPAVAAGFVNTTHVWVRLSSNQSGSTVSTSSTAANYVLLDRRLLAAAAHPVQLTVFNSTHVPSLSISTSTVNSRHFKTVDMSTTTEIPVRSAVSESGRCAANIFYPKNMTSTSNIVVLCQGTTLSTSSWSDTLPTQQVQWLGFDLDRLTGNELLVVTWMTTPSTAATFAWALRVYLTPSLQPNATTIVNTNSSRIPLSGCAEQQGCGIVSRCLVVPPGESGSRRLLCAAESSLLTANVVVLFVVDLSTGAPGATTSVVIPSADRVSASRSDIDYSISIFAFRGATTAMLARTVFDGCSDTLSLLSEYTMSLIQGERSTVLAMTLNTTTRTLWLSVATSQVINAVAVNLFAIRAVEPYVFDQRGGAVVTVQGVGFVRDPVPICEFQSVNTIANASLAAAQDRPSSASSSAIFVNSTTLLCISQEAVVVDGGQCNPVKVNVWYLGRSTSTTLVGSLRPLTATILSVSTTESGGLAMGYYASTTTVTLQGFGFVSSATRAACRLENSTSGEILAWWNASALNTTTAVCTQRGGAPLSGAFGVVRYSHDNATFSNAVSYIVVGPYSHVAAAFTTEAPIPVITAAPIVRLPAIVLTSVDEYGSPLGLFDTEGSAARQLTCLPQNPLFVATTSILTFTTSSTTKVTPINGTAILDAIVVVAPETDTNLDVSMTSTRFVFCYDILVPLNTVTLSLSIVPGPPVALTLVTTMSGSAVGGFASGVTSSVVLPTIVIAVMDAVGNYASIETSSALLPLQIVCTYTNKIPDRSGATSGIATSITTVSTIDPTSGTYSLENLNVQSQFNHFIELAVKPSNISVMGGPLQANAIQSLRIALPQRPCDRTALFAVSDTFECVECPTYAACDGTTNMIIPSGYWRGSSASLTLYPCDPASSCPTSLDCAIGYEGPMCGSCSPGYGRTVGSSCDACTSVVPQVITAFIVVGVVGIVWALGLRDIAFTAVEDIASRIVASPDATKRGPLPIIVKIVVSHLQLITLLPLSALEAPWAVSTAQGSGQWSVVTPSFLNVACVVGRRAHNEMIAVIALFGLALCGCALLSIVLAWLADRSFKKIALKISIRSRAKEVRTSGASPMRYRAADAMITTSHFRRAKHRDRVLRNHRDLLEVYVGDGEKEMEIISRIASSTHDKSNIDGGDFTHLFGSTMGDQRTSLFQSTTTSHANSPRRRTSAWFDADLDLRELEAKDIRSPTTFLPSGQQSRLLTQQTPLTGRSRGELFPHFVFGEAGEEKSLALEDRATVTNEQIQVGDLSSKSSLVIPSSPPLTKSSPLSLSDGKEDSLPLPMIKQRQMPTFSELVEPSRLAQPNLRPPPIMKRVVNLVLVSLVVLAFLLYPTIVQAAQRVITCRTLIARETTIIRVLSYDPDVDCTSSGYHHWLPMSLIVLVLVGAGFPLLCPGAVVIAQYTTCAGDSKNARHLFHFVTGGYRVWFWEAIVLFRKAAIVMALVVVGPERDAFQSFSIACSWIFGVSLALNVVLRPWLDEDLGRLELMSLAVLCASSLALAVQSSATPLHTTAVSIIFIAVNGIALLYFFRTVIVVAKGQALDLIQSEAPGIHDALQDRSGAIERLRRQCRATETMLRVTNARFANCYELVQFIEANILSVDDPIAAVHFEGGVSKSSSQPSEVQFAAPVVVGDVSDFDGDFDGLVLPPRRTEQQPQASLHHDELSALEADFSLTEFDFTTKSAHFDAEPQPAVRAFHQADMSLPSTSVLSHHPIDLWDMDIATLTPRRSSLGGASAIIMPQQHPWQLYDDNDDFDVVSTLLTAAAPSPPAAVRHELRAIPDRKTLILKPHAGNATDVAAKPQDERAEPNVMRKLLATREDMTNMRNHIQRFHSLAAMLPRTVGAYVADIAVHEQKRQKREQQRAAHDGDTEELLHSEQLATALCEILVVEKILFADAALFLR